MTITWSSWTKAFAGHSRKAARSPRKRPVTTPPARPSAIFADKLLRFRAGCRDVVTIQSSRVSAARGEAGIFQDALAHEAGQRDAFVDGACGDDRALRQLALYQERHVKPRRPDPATRVILVLLSRLLVSSIRVE